VPDFEYDAEKGRFRGWLCTMTGNEVRMLLRKKKALLDKLDEKRKSELSAYVEQVDPSPSEDLAEEEWAVYIASRAWANIEGRFSDVVKEVFERLSKKEDARQVAEDFDLSPKSVYVYKKRVQDALVSEMARLNEELA
jgi:DNA-directed RNA polymerase specialized sigma24 family protein